MAPAEKTDRDDDECLENGISADTGSIEAALKAKRRTKTGCLTCRKRRIKCGEERPICRNCIKSKRICDGYNQRVVFKPPTFDYRATPHGGAHITFHAESLPQTVHAFPPDFVHAADPSLYAQLRPRPSGPLASDFQYVQGAEFVPPTELAHSNFFNGQIPVPPMPFMAPPPHPSSHQPIGVPPTISTPLPLHLHHQPHPQQPQQWPPNGFIRSSADVSPGSSLSPNGTANVYDPAARWKSDSIVSQSDHLRSLVSSSPIPSTGSSSQLLDHPGPLWHDYEGHVSPTSNTTHLLHQAAVEKQDDDYYDFDVDMDGEVDTWTGVSTRNEHDRQRTLGKILELNNISIQDLQTRRYDTFLYEGMMDHYRVERVANPLKNEATARVFAHFIAVTGPGLSVFERHPRNTAMLFAKGEVPFTQQGLWTYTMPMAALHHQGLLHSMLAMASLHIARLTKACVTPSMQHYAWALKRVHHDVGHPKRRHQITTIAASMLLGFYEIMTADHMKWNMHLMGSKQLFVETEFETMARTIRRMKVQRAQKQTQANGACSDFMSGSLQDELLDQISDVDDHVISRFVGKEVRYGDHGHVEGPDSPPLPETLDLSKYEILRDLYWWYCKQDAYQSIVSGNPLIMEYGRWANCPPRAPLGRVDAVYGSFDHLMLILARIADFASRDRTRKLRQMEANGGQWRPPTDMKMPRPPSGMSTPGGETPAAPPSAGTGSPPGIMFFGMAPPPRGDVKMPSSYKPSSGTASPHAPPSPQDPIDLQQATQAALKEYGEIRAALHEFSARLGPGFAPLSPEYQPVLDTPFGQAIFFRSFDISVLWAVWNMAIIIAIRSAPHMPPAAHMAAGVAAQETAHFANNIGRILAGIVPDPPHRPLNPSLGAALSESCMPAFFAAVQYHDAAQRYATVMRIYSIALRTGWGSAELIANGCETAWVKAAAAGRGPPYTRVVRPQHSDDPRLNGSWESLDPRADPDGRDEDDRRLVHRDAKARLKWAIGIMGTEEDVRVSSP